MHRIAAVVILGLVMGLSPALANDPASRDAALQTASSNGIRSEAPPISATPARQAGDPARFAQRCPIPQCPPNAAVCNVRRAPNGCVAWDCCPRR